MNIGYLYNFHAFPPRGGNYVHAMELTQGFLHFGHKVSVVDDPTMPGVTNFGSSLEDIKRFIQDIDVLYVRIDARFIRRWKVLAECTRLADSIPIVWEINAPANETQAFSWLSGRPADGKESVIRRFRRWLHATRKVPSILLEERYRQQLAKSVNYATCVSKALGTYAREGLGINDVLVLPNGGALISEEEIMRRRAHRQHKGYTVLYTGSAMYPWQGLNYLSGVIALAEKEAPDITFVLAVNQRTPALPTSKNVVIVERLDREEILDAICAADACVCLHPEYFWSKYNFHGSPMKMFEYMACMSPVVASDIGQMHDILQDGEDGVLCENNPQDILKKIVKLKNNPKKAGDIGRNGWLRINTEFNWNRNVEKTLEVFERCIANRPQG